MTFASVIDFEGSNGGEWWYIQRALVWVPIDKLSYLRPISITEKTEK